jgi:regulator of protease activity HflC (stomatin/prohibitin superfamily)
MIALIVIIIAVVSAVVLAGFGRAVRIVPQARAYVIERLGSYSRTLDAGLNTVVPFIDRVRARIDLREQVVSFAPQPVITEDNLVVHIDTVPYFQVTDPKAATYEIANFIQAIEQLTVTTLRNVIGGLDLERTLTSREQINAELRGVLDEATGKWGIRVNRVELKAIDPPGSIKDAMEKQLRADRDKRAAILTAEGARQAQILTAEGAKQGAILTAEGAKQAAILTAQGERQAQILLAQGQAQAIGTVFEAIHQGRPDPELLAYQYLQTLPKIASGDGNHTWLIPSELTRALDALTSGFGDRRTQAAAAPVPSISTANQVAPAALAPVPPTNGHTSPTGRRGSKRTAGTQQEGEHDRLSGAPRPGRGTS